MRPQTCTLTTSHLSQHSFKVNTSHCSSKQQLQKNQTKKPTNYQPKNGRGESITIHPHKKKKYDNYQRIFLENKTWLTSIQGFGKSFFGLTIIECYAS